VPKRTTTTTSVDGPRALGLLTRFVDALARLEIDNGDDNDGDDCNPGKDGNNGSVRRLWHTTTPIAHWCTLPPPHQFGVPEYDNGASLLRNASTKYALVTKATPPAQTAGRLTTPCQNYSRMPNLCWAPGPASSSPALNVDCHACCASSPKNILGGSCRPLCCS
jgi:hypothetical protein